MGRKALYESIQVLERRIEAQNRLIAGLTTSNPENEINPFVKNNFSYNIVLQTADRIQSTSRYIGDIPELELPSNKLECLFYDYGALCFARRDGHCQLASFAKTGSLNGLGDLKEVIPIDFAGQSWDIKYNVVYTNKLADNPAVIIQDYTGSYKEDGIYPRSALNAVSINDQALIYRQLKNAIKITAKKAVALCEGEGARKAAESNLENIIESDNPIISIIGDGVYEQMKFFNLDTKLDIEGYMRAIEAFERLRANFNGMQTRTPMDKKERQITQEVQNDNVLTDIYLYDGLINRQIGIELCKKHSIIREGSYKFNPLVDPELRKKREEESKKLDKKENNNG